MTEKTLRISIIGILLTILLFMFYIIQTKAQTTDLFGNNITSSTPITVIKEAGLELNTSNLNKDLLIIYLEKQLYQYEKAAQLCARSR